MKSKKLIIWAVDPFCEESTLVRRTARAVALLAHQWKADVAPVYLLSDYPRNARLLPALEASVRDQACRDFERLLKGIQVPRLRELTLLDAGSDLVQYARSSQADVIALGTRAKSGPSRWMLGSFAESLIAKSDIPLYVVNPSDVVPRKIENILFATDFSAESKEAFGRVIRMASAMKASLTLYHRLKYDTTPALEIAFGVSPAYKRAFEEEIRERQAEADLWANEAAAAKVRVETIVDYKMGSGSVADSVIRKAKKRGGMIALAARSGPFKSSLLGSLPRQLVRNAQCPVWVVHVAPLLATDLAFDVTEKDLYSDLIDHGRGSAAV